MSAGENGGGQRGKFGADGCCVRIAWDFSGVWMDTYRVVLFLSQLTVQIVSAICDCWLISLSRFCWLELFGVAFIFCDAWSSAVYVIPELCAVVSLNLGSPTAFSIENYPAKYMILAAKLNVEEYANGSLLYGGNYIKEKIDGSNPDDHATFEKGIMQYGCPHYKRRCRIRAPCCNEIFDCRHCHNEVKNSIKIDTVKRHELPRHEVQQVICSLCGTEQQVQQVCINCGVCMGKYFCGLCKLFDDDVSKQQYHCNGCGICRIGGRQNFFHCSKCGCCYSIVLKNSHACVEGAMHHDCPICFEYLFESTNDVSVLPCGHTIHVKCLKEMEEHCQFACPLCSKSVCDMSKAWERLDMELATLSDSCDDKMVRILCNDCGAISEVQFHLIAHKCQNCKSYNTRQI
ncbi:unnamed protein product [Urochloa humidicola]